MSSYAGSIETTAELDVCVEYAYTPGREAVMTLSNGDPGYPAEPEELEVTGIFVGRGKDRISILKYFTDDQVELIADQALEDRPEDDHD